MQSQRQAKYLQYSTPATEYIGSHNAMLRATGRPTDRPTEKHQNHLFVLISRRRLIKEPLRNAIVIWLVLLSTTGLGLGVGAGWGGGGGRHGPRPLSLSHSGLFHDAVSGRQLTSPSAEAQLLNLHPMNIH